MADLCMKTTSMPFAVWRLLLWERG